MSEDKSSGVLGKGGAVEASVGKEFPYALRPSTFQQRLDRNNYEFQNFSEENDGGVAKVDPISILTEQMSRLMDKLESFEVELKELKQSPSGVVPNPNAEVVRVRAGDVHAPGTDDFKFLVERMSQASENAQFAQISTALPNFTGKEGRTKIRSYFRQIESMTLGWSSKRKANLLAIHLIGQARNVFEGLSEEAQEDYDSVKNALLSDSCGLASLRITAQNEFLRECCVWDSLTIPKSKPMPKFVNSIPSQQHVLLQRRENLRCTTHVPGRDHCDRRLIAAQKFLVERTQKAVQYPFDAALIFSLADPLGTLKSVEALSQTAGL